MDEKIKSIIEEKGFVEKMLACEEPEQVQALFAAKGVDLSLDEIHSISNGLSSSLNNSDELDEDDLDFVAGGATTVTTTVTTVVTTVTTVTKTVTYDWAKIKRYFRRW